MQTTAVPVSELSLDLNNYRSTPQPDEVSAVKAMIATSRLCCTNQVLISEEPAGLVA